MSKSITINSFVRLHDGKFKGKTDIVSVTFDKSCVNENIPSRCFEQCINLETVSLPPSIKKIGQNAFSLCYNLETVVMPPSVEFLGDSAFASCRKLASIDMSKFTKLSTFNSKVFYQCFNLTSVDMSSCTNLAIIGPEAFSFCTGLEAVVLPPSVNKIGKSAFLGCKKLTSLDMSNYENLTIIGPRAFMHCDNLRKIALPPFLNKIDKFVFAECDNLTSIDMSKCNYMITIESYAFYNSENLQKIHLPSSLFWYSKAHTIQSAIKNLFKERTPQIRFLFNLEIYTYGDTMNPLPVAPIDVFKDNKETIEDKISAAMPVQKGESYQLYVCIANGDKYDCGDKPIEKDNFTVDFLASVIVGHNTDYDEISGNQAQREFCGFLLHIKEPDVVTARQQHHDSFGGGGYVWPGGPFVDLCINTSP